VPTDSKHLQIRIINNHRVAYLFNDGDALVDTFFFHIGGEARLFVLTSTVVSPLPLFLCLPVSDLPAFLEVVAL